MAYQLGFMLGLMVGGALFGLIPFFVGRKKGYKQLGLIGLIVSAVCALIHSWASIIAAIVFTIIICNKAK